MTVWLLQVWMRVLLSLLVLILLSYSPLTCGFQTRSFTTESSMNRAMDLLKSMQDPESGMFADGSLTQTFHAISSLVDNGVNIPNQRQLCASLRKTKANSWNDLFEIIMARSMVSDCLTELKPATLDKIKQGLVSDQLSQIYYSTQLASVMVEKKFLSWSDFDLTGAATKLGSMFDSKKNMFAETKGGRTSAFRTGQGLIAISSLLKVNPDLLDNLNPINTPSVISNVWKSLTKSAKEDDKYLSFQSSITVTSMVLNAFQLIPDSLNSELPSKLLSRERLDKLTRYIFEYENVADAKVRSNVVTAFDALESLVGGSDSAPLFISVSNSKLDGSRLTKAKPVKFIVQSIFEESISSLNVKVDVTVEKSEKAQSSVKLTADADGKTFKFDLVKFLKTNAGLAKDTPLFGSYPVKLTVNGDVYETVILIQSKLTNVALKSGIAKKNSDLSSQVDYPEQVDSIYEVSPTSRVKLELSFDTNIVPSVVGFEIASNNNDDQFSPSLSVPGKKRLGHYALLIDTNKSPFNKLKEGVYTVTPMITDPLIDTSIVWDSAVSIQVFEEEDDLPKDYEPVNDEVPRFKPKEPLNHTFGPPPPTGNSLITLIFIGVCSLPLLGLFIGIKSVGISLSIPSSLVEMGFAGSLITTGGVFLMYWLSLGIFQAGFNLFITVVLTAVFGYRTLKNHLIQRLESPSAHMKSE